MYGRQAPAARAFLLLFFCVLSWTLCYTPRTLFLCVIPRYFSVRRGIVCLHSGSTWSWGTFTLPRRFLDFKNSASPYKSLHRGKRQAEKELAR